jgi:probable HAF family extracellular repeat protein
MLAFISGNSLWRSSVILVLAVGIDLAPSRAAAQTYSITALGTLCDPSSGFLCPAPAAGGTAFDVNNWGQVVGTSPWVDDDGAVGQFGCYRTAPNEAINPATDRLILDTAAQALPCVAYSINDNGSVVGTRWNSQGMTQARAFGYGNQMITLSTALPCGGAIFQLGCSTSYGFALNSTGTIVGSGWTGDFDKGQTFFHAFRVRLPVDGCCFDDLGALPLRNLPNASEASSINDSNVIVGSSYTAPGGVVQRAVVFGGQEAVFDLGTLGGGECPFCSSAANAINNVGAGQVVGWSTLSVSGPRHAFLLELGFLGPDMVDLGDLCSGNEHGLCRSEAFAINDFGQIVGESQTMYGSQSTHAFVYRAQTGVMEDLNHALSLVDRVLWELTDARGINDLGQIVGTGLYLGDQIRPYRLDPLPPQLATNLDQLLEHFGLADRGIEQSLHRQLRAIQNALARDDRAAACGQTIALDRELRAQAGRGLTRHQATTMMAGAALLHRQLICQ